MHAAATLAIVTALVAGVVASTDIGRLALLDQWERTALAFGAEIDEGRYDALRAWSRDFGPLYAVGATVARGPVLSLLLATLITWLCRARLATTLGAGQPRFHTVMAVVVHAGVVLALRDVLTAVVSYLRESSTSPGQLSLWLPALDAASLAGRMLGALDLFVVWWLVVLAIGVGLLLQRSARPLAYAFVGLYLGVAVALAVTTAMLDAGT